MQHAVSKIETERKQHELDLREAESLLPPEKRHLVRVLQEFVFFRTYRTDLFKKSFYKIHNLLYRLAGEMGVTYEQLACCTIDEIESQSLPSEKELEARVEANAFLGYGGKMEVLTGSELAEFKKSLLEETAFATELKGKVACVGKAVGICKIIVSPKDYPKFERGDILVSPMTNPDMMPLLEKAAAFVTDEGGLTCHAAIISRELNKPCVIGTKIATKVLKDGDLVEVDATKGVIKKVRG